MPMSFFQQASVLRIIVMNFNIIVVVYIKDNVASQCSFNK